MQTLVVRYTWQHLVVVAVIGFMGATAAELAHRGYSFIVRAWADPRFWRLMIPIMTVLALIIWAIPAARLSQEAISSTSYPFRIRWSDVTRARVTSFLGMTRLKVYGARSCFGLAIPLAGTRTHAIYSFLQGTKGTEVILAAFADERVGQALQPTDRL
jgi:hypothetical protein